jgi:hypothetical protein
LPGNSLPDKTIDMKQTASNSKVKQLFIKKNIVAKFDYFTTQNRKFEKLKIFDTIQTDPTSSIITTVISNAIA